MNKRIAKKKLKMLEKKNQIATNAPKTVKNKVEQPSTSKNEVQQLDIEKTIIQPYELKIKKIIQSYKKELKTLYGLSFVNGASLIISTTVMIECFESYIKTKNTPLLLSGFVNGFCAVLNAGCFGINSRNTFYTYKDYLEAKRLKSNLTR